MSRIRKFVEKRADTVVISNRAERRNRGIAPTVILDEFPSIRAEASQIRIRRIQNRSRLLIAERDVRVEVQAAVVPLWILKDRLAVVGASETILNRRRDRSRRNPRRPSCRSCLRAARIPGENRSTRARVLRPVINLPKSFHLRRCEALGTLRPLASQSRRIEMARSRILQQPVFHAVQSVACGHHCILNQRKFRGRDCAARRLCQRSRVPYETGEKVRPVARRRAGDDSVKVFRRTAALPSAPHVRHRSNH